MLEERKKVPKGWVRKLRLEKKFESMKSFSQLSVVYIGEQVN